MTKKLWILIGLVLTSVVLFSWAPLGIRLYIDKHYPGVKAHTVHVHWGQIALNDVEIDRPGIKGRLDSVGIDWDKNITISGGAITVDLDHKSEDTRTGTTSIQGHSLQIDVTKGGVKAHLTDTDFTSTDITFKTADVTYEEHKATVHQGHLARARGDFDAEQVEVPFTLPFEIPKLSKVQLVQLTKVRANLQNRAFHCEEARLDPFFKMQAAQFVDSSDQYLLSFDSIGVNHPWISPDLVSFGKVSLRVPKTILRGEGAITLSIGPTVVTIEPSRLRIVGAEPCNDWVEAMPTPMPDALSEARGHFTGGELGFEVYRLPPAGHVDQGPTLKVHNSCRYTCTEEPILSLTNAIRRGTKPFTYMAYDKDDKLFARELGLMAKDWVSIITLPPSIPKAFITMEDPGFNSHQGIIPQALENSFKDDLKIGRFFRGGSTISMQLAKNLWLRRHKTLGRKAQEALLTIALESCLTKAEILELYLNAVEFGPNLYGIGPAAKRYFNKTAANLEPEEAFYLASILPHPRNAIPPESGGLKRIHGLMRVLADKGLISDALVPVREDEVDASGWATE